MRSTRILLVLIALTALGLVVARAGAAGWAQTKARSISLPEVTLPTIQLHEPTTTTTDPAWWRPTTTTTRPPPPTTATTLAFLNLDDIVRSQAGIAGYDGDRAVAVGGDACRRMDAGVSIAGLDDPQLLGIAVGVLCPWHFMGALDNGWLTAGDVEQ